MEHEWKPVHSLNDRYEVTDTGLVRNSETKKILKPQKDASGYPSLTVRPIPKQQRTVKIHRLVAEVFIGECPKGYVVNHKDGNKQNNNINNLEYVTSSENNIHALKNGLRHVADMNKVIKKGEDSPFSVLTEEDVKEILRERYRTGDGCRKIAKRLNLSRGAVQGVLSETRPRWKHIDREIIKKEIKEEKKNA